MSSKALAQTQDKALQLNLASTIYGTFAEIGAGQETANWFFRASGAAGTVAKTISAYDMTVSDTLYGPVKRYVSEERLKGMLDYEFTQLVNRLGPPAWQRHPLLCLLQYGKSQRLPGQRPLAWLDRGALPAETGGKTVRPDYSRSPERPGPRPPDEGPGHPGRQHPARRLFSKGTVWRNSLNPWWTIWIPGWWK